MAERKTKSEKPKRRAARPREPGKRKAKPPKVDRDLLEPLLTIQGLDEARAAALYRAGVRTIKDLQRISVAELTSVEGIGPDLAQRLKENVVDPEDSLEVFTELPGVGRAKAEQLLESGYRNLYDLQRATVEELAEVLGEPVAEAVKLAVGEYDPVLKSSEVEEELEFVASMEEERREMGPGERRVRKLLGEGGLWLPEGIVIELAERLDRVGGRVPDSRIRDLLRRVHAQYEANTIDPTEAAGIVGAQSIGEPGTQMTMRTFHYAGVAEINVTLGLPRLIEVVDARRVPSTPMMEVYLEQDYRQSLERAQQVANEMEATHLIDLASIDIDLGQLTVVVTPDEKKLRRKGLHVEQVADKLKRFKGCAIVVGEDGKVTLKPENPTYKSLLTLASDAKRTLLKGIPDISRVVIRRELKDGYDGYVVYTEGSNLAKVMQIVGVDTSRTTTNNFREIWEVLGIEAARRAIVNEAQRTLQEQGLTVDVRHLMLVADVMTVDGTIRPIGRHGISGEKSSVLARAAFEITVNHLLEAGVVGEVDPLEGVAENIIVGQPVQLGTGAVQLVMKPDPFRGAKIIRPEDVMPKQDIVLIEEPAGGAAGPAEPEEGEEGPKEGFDPEKTAQGG